MATKRSSTSLDTVLGIQRPEGFDWGSLYRAIPIRALPSRRKWYAGQEEKRAELVGMVFLREYRTGLRFKLKVVQDKRDGSIFCHFPSFKMNTLMGEVWSEEVTLDNQLESYGLLKWATELWLQAIVDGGGVLAYRSIRADKYEFHPVTSAGSLKPNAYGRLPWSEHARSFRESGYTRSDHAPSEAQGGAEERNSGPGYFKGSHSQVNGDLPHLLQEPSGDEGVREAVDRDQWIQARPERDNPSGEPDSNRDV